MAIVLLLVKKKFNHIKGATKVGFKVVNNQNSYSPHGPTHMCYTAIKLADASTNQQLPPGLIFSLEATPFLAILRS